MVRRIGTIDDKAYTVQNIATKARRFIFEEIYAALTPVPPAPHSFEFWVGGYDSDRTQGHSVWKIEIVNGQCPSPIPIMAQGAIGLFVGGQSGPLERLVRGFDPAAHGVLVQGG